MVIRKMNMQAMLEDLGLEQSASQHEILNSIREKQEQLEYLIAAIDDQDVREEYLREISQLSKMTTQLKASKQSSQNNRENVHQLPIDNSISSSTPRSRDRAAIIASMSGKTTEVLAKTQDVVQATSKIPVDGPLVAKKRYNGVRPNKQTNPKSHTLTIVAAVVIISIIVVGVLIENGKIALSTSDEVAFEIASVEKIRGEIGSYQSRFEKAQLQQNSTSTLNSVTSKISNQINITIFSADQFSEIDGDISMGESFLKQEKFSQAIATLTSVKDRYQSMWLQYSSSQEVIDSIHLIEKLEDSWLKLNKLHSLQLPAEINLAQTARDSALIEIDQGNFYKASEYLKSAELNWINAQANIKRQIEIQKLEVEKQQYEIAEAERALQDELQQAKEAEQLALERTAALDAQKAVEEAEQLALERQAALDAKMASEEAAIQQEKEKQLALLQEAKLSEKLTPVTNIEPKYPKKAILNATQGWVDVGFNVSATGLPTDIVILDAKPKRIFNKAALNAIRQATFMPLISNGQNIVRTNAFYRIEFILD